MRITRIYSTVQLTVSLWRREFMHPAGLPLWRCGNGSVGVDAWLKAYHAALTHRQSAFAA